MNQPYYSFIPFNNALRYDFLSVGKDVISKAVVYRESDVPHLYSLALLNVYADGSADDTSVSNNGDMEKILVTVYNTFSIFFQHYPESMVFFEGSTASRTRLYQIAISHEWTGIREMYNVWGITGETYEPFEKDRQYSGFLFSLKDTNIA